MYFPEIGSFSMRICVVTLKGMLSAGRSGVLVREAAVTALPFVLPLFLPELLSALLPPLLPRVDESFFRLVFPIAQASPPRITTTTTRVPQLFRIRLKDSATQAMTSLIEGKDKHFYRSNDQPIYDYARNIKKGVCVFSF